MKSNKFSNLLYILAATMIAEEYFSLWGVSITYMICGLIFVISFLSHKSIPKNKTIYDFIPIFFTLLYVYGFSVGVLKNNPTNYIFTNFAGLFLFFFLYQFSIQRFNLEQILKLSKAIAIIFVIEILVYLLIANLIGEVNARLLAQKYHLKGLASDAGEYTTRYFIPNSSWIFILVIMYAHSILTGEKRYIHLTTGLTHKFHGFLFPLFPIITITLILYLLLILTQSKGFMLAALISISMLVISSFYRSSAYKKLIYLVALIVFIISQYGFLFSIIQDIYSIESSGNSKRYEQISLVIDRFSIFGNGLGASFDGFASAHKNPTNYGIELTYLNLIDKLGIFGLMLSIIYFFIYFKFITYLFKKNKKFIGLLGLGLTSFIWPSIGNPMLLSVSYVISFLFAIRLISIAEYT